MAFLHSFASGKRMASAVDLGALTEEAAMLAMCFAISAFDSIVLLNSSSVRGGGGGKGELRGELGIGGGGGRGGTDKTGVSSLFFLGRNRELQFSRFCLGCGV
ncbi:MAG: hypothetical protein AAGM67_21885 [Bacteroidota bacterium]